MEGRKVVTLTREEYARYRKLMDTIQTSRSTMEIKACHQEAKELLEQVWQKQGCKRSEK